MYDLKLDNNEKIQLISDNSLIYMKEDKTICTSIITNKRFLILDYPSKYHNSMEDLRISGKITYIKQKEVIFETGLENILKIDKDKIMFKDNSYILIEDEDIANYLIKRY